MASRESTFKATDVGSGEVNRVSFPIIAFNEEPNSIP
jgi:hypothetical protein